MNLIKKFSGRYHTEFITSFSKLNSGVYFHVSFEDSNFHSSEKPLQDKFGIKYFCMLTRQEGDPCHQFSFGRSSSSHQRQVYV